jgi:hypothetical protein
MRGRAIPAGIVFVLSACATPDAGDLPKIVQGQPLPSYQIHEECLALKPGERVLFRFESTEPVDFNIHYHEGKIVVMPLTRDKSTGDAGVFATPVAQDYCLMWEAGRAGALLDYRIRLRRADF